MGLPSQIPTPSLNPQILHFQLQKELGVVGKMKIQSWNGTGFGATWDSRSHGKIRNVLRNSHFHFLLPEKSGISENSQTDSFLQFHLFPKSPNPKFPTSEGAGGAWKEENPILELEFLEFPRLERAWSDLGYWELAWDGMRGYFLGIF